MLKVHSYVFLILVILTVCGNNTSKRKCILVVPGIGSCGLFPKNHDSDVYPYGTNIFLRMNGFTLDGLKSLYESLRLFIDHHDIISCNDDGTPVNKKIGILDTTQNLSQIDNDIHNYGIFSLYRNFITKARTEVGENWEVKLFNYDWRLDCALNAELLVNEIKKYDEVVLIGYSMGGLISCKACVSLLNCGELKKIKQYISVCVPYNGSIDAIFALDSGVMPIGVLNSILKFEEYDKFLKQLVLNFTSMYELIPLDCFYKHDGSIDIKCKNNIFNDKLVQKAYKFLNSLHVNGKHIVSYLPNKVFFYGNGKNTKSSIKDNKVEYSDGDGTVTIESALYPIKDDNSVDKHVLDTYHSMVWFDDTFVSKLVNIAKNTCNDNFQQ